MPQVAPTPQPTRVQNVITASNNARQLAARWWAAHIYMAVNYGRWFRNTTHLEIETSEGLIDLSRAVYSTRTSNRDKGVDTRGGLLVENRDWQTITTEGHMQFYASINLAKYEWENAINHTVDSWIVERIAKYLTRQPRYGSHHTAFTNLENPDKNSRLHEGERRDCLYICEPSLEQGRDAAQVLAFMALEHQMPKGCLAFSQKLISGVLE